MQPLRHVPGEPAFSLHPLRPGHLPDLRTVSEHLPAAAGTLYSAHAVAGAVQRRMQTPEKRATGKQFTTLVMCSVLKLCACHLLCREARQDREQAAGEASAGRQFVRAAADRALGTVLAHPSATPWLYPACPPISPPLSPCRPPAVKCTACHTNMQPMRFLDDQQLALLQQARHRLDAALGGALSGGSCGGSVGSGNAVAAAGAGASPLPRLLWNLCKGSCGCEHDRAEWIEPETDWLQRLRQAAAFSACHAPPPQQQQQAQQAAQQLGQQQPSLVQPPQQQQQGEAAAAALQACATAGGSGAAPSQAGDLAKTQALLALMQAQAPDAATRQRQQQLLQPLLVLQSRAEGRAMPDWAARPEQWTPAMVQHAQHAVQPLAARVQAVAGQPGQVLALQAQPPLLQQPPLQLLQAPQLLPYSTASGAASQEAPWPRLVSRPSVQQPGDGGGWNAGQFIRAAAAEQLQHQAQQQHAQHAVANGMLLQRQAHVNGVRSAEGSADDGSEARPKRQRKVSQKLRDAEEGEEGEVAGQHRQQAQQAQQQAVPAAGGAAAGAAAGGQLPAAAQLPKELSLLEKDAVRRFALEVQWSGLSCMTA